MLRKYNNLANPVVHKLSKSPEVKDCPSEASLDSLLAGGCLKGKLPCFPAVSRVLQPWEGLQPPKLGEKETRKQYVLYGTRQTFISQLSEVDGLKIRKFGKLRFVGSRLGRKLGI